ncbi:MAG: hypothetical protein ACREIP_06400 [Alphaproteobacteria bacterium]
MAAAAIIAAEEASADEPFVRFVNAIRVWNGAKTAEARPQTQGEQDGTAENRITR